MNHHLHLIPEDGAIRALLIVLGFHNPNHSTGIGETLNKIEKQFRNRFAIGIIDDDKRKPKLFDQYEEVESENDLRLLKKPDSKHCLIIVQPAIEHWLWNAANTIDYTPPFQSIQALKNITKNQSVLKNPPFRRFLDKLYTAEAPGFVTLKAWIDVLNEGHY